MRKPRIILYDDEKGILSFLTDFFTVQGYEVLAFPEPHNCPIYEDSHECGNLPACSDLIMTDFQMPRMNGLELLRNQSRGGCKVPAENRAIASGWLDDGVVDAITAMGCRAFQKPFDFKKISGWLKERESHFDLTQPLAIKRKSERSLSDEEIECVILPDNTRLRGVCIDSSAWGICVRIGSPLSTGQYVTVHSVSSSAPKAALVRWSRRSGEDSYLTGLQFENP